MVAALLLAGHHLVPRVLMAPGPFVSIADTVPMFGELSRRDRTIHLRLWQIAWRRTGRFSRCDRGHTDYDSCDRSHKQNPRRRLNAGTAGGSG